MTAPRPDEDASRRWACETFGISADLTPSRVQRTLFRLVEQSRFKPSPELTEAADALSGRGIPYDLRAELSRFHQARERAILANANRFTAEFFLLAPSDRRIEWNSLTRMAESYPLARARLRRLERSLDLPTAIPPELPPDDAVRMLVDRLRLVDSSRRAAMLRQSLQTISELRLRQMADVAAELSDENHWLAAVARGLCEELRASMEQSQSRISNWDEQRGLDRMRRDERDAVRFQDEYEETPVISPLDLFHEAVQRIKRNAIALLVLISVITFATLLVNKFWPDRDPDPQFGDRPPAPTNSSF